ncbi:MAG: CBS domain-containing protein [Myxococcota bacterium]
MADLMAACCVAGRVAQMMTPEPVTVLPDTAAWEVWETMNGRRFRHMPIADAEGILVGIVSIRDLMLALHSQEGTDAAKGVQPIAELMHPEVDTVRADCCAGEAARHMLRTKRSCLPVVEKAGRLIGILTEADFLRNFMRSSPPCSCGGLEGTSGT